MDDPPPPYSFKETPRINTQQVSQPSSSVQDPKSAPPKPASQQPQQPPSQPAAIPLQQLTPHVLSTLLHAHQPIGIYSAGFRDLCLSLSADSPPLCHITIHSLRTPSITLHSGATADSAPLATAQYNFLSATGIEILTRTPIRKELQKTGYWPEAWSFEMVLSRAGKSVREGFEWKYSRGEEVQAVGGRNRGLKCVRVGTGEVVCAWAWTVVSARKVGKFRWVGGESWGEEAELMVVATLLAVVERIRRDERRRYG
jgi:hypothetical protein